MQGDMSLSARPKTLRPLISELHQLRAKDAEQRRSQKQAQIDRLIRSHAETEGSSPRKPFIRRIVAEAEAPVDTVRDRVRVVCGKLG